MGRHAGWIATYAGIAGGAAEILPAAGRNRGARRRRLGPPHQPGNRCGAGPNGPARADVRQPRRAGLRARRKSAPVRGPARLQPGQSPHVSSAVYSRPNALGAPRGPKVNGAAPPARRACPSCPRFPGAGLSREPVRLLARAGPLRRIRHGFRPCTGPGRPAGLRLCRPPTARAGLWPGARAGVAGQGARRYSARERWTAWILVAAWSGVSELSSTYPAPINCPRRRRRRSRQSAAGEGRGLAAGLGFYGA